MPVAFQPTVVIAFDAAVLFNHKSNGCVCICLSPTPPLPLHACHWLICCVSTQRPTAAVYIHRHVCRSSWHFLFFTRWFIICWQRSNRVQPVIAAVCVSEPVCVLFGASLLSVVGNMLSECSRGTVDLPSFSSYILLYTKTANINFFVYNQQRTGFFHFCVVFLKIWDNIWIMCVLMLSRHPTHVPCDTLLTYFF